MATHQQYQVNTVVLMDIDVPFHRAVSIMIKWILAAIPAAFLATIIVYGIIFLFGLILGGVFPEFFGFE